MPSGIHDMRSNSMTSVNFSVGGDGITWGWADHNTMIIVASSSADIYDEIPFGILDFVVVTEDVLEGVSEGDRQLQ